MMPYLSMQRRQKSIGRSGQQLRREVHNSVVLDGIHKIAQLCGQQASRAIFLVPTARKSRAPESNAYTGTGVREKRTSYVLCDAELSAIFLNK